MSGLAGAVARWLGPAWPWLGTAVLGAMLWTYTPGVGPAARLKRAQVEAAAALQSARDWRGVAESWRASFMTAETLRDLEAETAEAAATALLEQCAVRVAEARQSARAIERIITKEPIYDENRCPVRERVDSDELRQALAPGA